MNVGDYNTLDLVMERKKENMMNIYIFLTNTSLKCKRKAIMYYSSPGAI